jgi:AraC family transcriptional regulator
MEPDVHIVAMPELRVAALPHRGPYDGISQAFGRLGQIAGTAGLFGPASAMLAIYHDDPRTTPAAELRSDAGIVIDEGVTLPEGLVERRIPGGRFARTIHVGPYDELPEIWRRFGGEWLARSGHKRHGGASFEIYRNTPGEVPPEKLITELYIRIA